MKIKTLILIGIIFLTSNIVFADTNNYLFDSYKSASSKNINKIVESVKQSKYKNAEKSLRNLKEFDKQTIEYDILQADIELNKGNYTNAEKYLQTGLSRNDCDNKYLLFNEFAKCTQYRHEKRRNIKPNMEMCKF